MCVLFQSDSPRFSVIALQLYRRAVYNLNLAVRKGHIVTLENRKRLSSTKRIDERLDRCTDNPECISANNYPFRQTTYDL